MGVGQRIGLAFRAFFALLGSGRVPADVIEAAAEDAQPSGDGAETPATADTVTAAADDGALAADGAVLLLSVLQREGRLVDFLQEDLAGYSDAQIGAAVRDVHANCRRALGGAFDLEPVLDVPENDTSSVEPGTDPAQVKLVGRVVGSGPYRGVVRHRGWQVTRVQLPSLAAPAARRIVAPAEVEV
jgi:hypothetical protein